jgi:hypothetical protein
MLPQADSIAALRNQPDGRKQDVLNFLRSLDCRSRR